MEPAKKLYGLVGYPLGHSFSAKFFNDKFRKECICAEYRNFEIADIQRFPEVLTDKNIAGLNVTIPYKQLIIGFLSGIDHKAQQIGAVNTIKIIRGKEQMRTIGFNTDIIGFKESIKPLLNPSHHSALILGSGGASKAVKMGLQELGIATTVVSRTPKPEVLTYGELTESILNRNTIIVNATPLGMYPNVESAPDFPFQFLTNRHLCYDLVYNPEETQFLKLAKKQHAATKNGYEMLVRQALAAWKIWNG